MTYAPGTLLKSLLWMIVLTIGASTVHGAGKHPEIGIAYYDVDRLYDTVASPFYDDRKYTPDGDNHWNTERYQNKVRHTAALLDSLSVPIVALFGVENEQVVRDISAACNNDYTYIHRTLNRRDGLDFALLYYGDIFFPATVHAEKHDLYIEGRVGCDTLGIWLCANNYTLQTRLPQLQEDRPDVRLVVLGKFDAKSLKNMELYDATAQPESRGHGNIRNRFGWWMRDRIALDPTLKVRRCDSYIQRWLLNERGYPDRTYSAYLPIFVYFSTR